MLRKFNSTLLSSIWTLPTFGDVTPPGGEGDDTLVGSAGGDPANKDDKKFTQADVNRLLAENKRNLQKKNDELIEQLKARQERDTTTEEEKLKLQERIDQLSSEHQTTEQKHQRAFSDLQKKSENDLKAATQLADSWKSRFTNHLIGRTLVDAAHTHQAFNPVQIEAILRPNTKLVEKLDDGGKPTGEFEPKVTFSDVDKDQKPIVVELTVAEAVKRMTEMPNLYGNLFKTTARSGLGGDNSGTPIEIPSDLSKMSMEDYAKKRGTIMSKMK